MSSKIVDISLFGACIVRAKNSSWELSGAKHKALFALLATAPHGRRTRAWLQESLWGDACYDSGRQSLRRALSDIKQTMGPAFDTVVQATHSEISLRLETIDFSGRPGAGEFLEGLDIRESGFNHWLTSIRVSPDQVHSLYSLPSQAPARPVLPVLAVIPFRALAASHEQAALGDWLAEEVTRSLSRSNLLTVISHLSSRRIASKAIDISDIETRLDADFCVCGTLRSDTGRITLDADFIDVRTGHILWTRRFSGALGDFISHDAPSIAHIVRTVGSTIADEAIRHVSGRAIQSVDDHRVMIAGVGLMHKPGLREFARSRELITEAITRAPRSAEPHAWLGKWYVLSVFNGWTTDAARDTKLAIDCTARALDIDPHCTFSLTIDGFAHNNLLRRMDIAASRYSEALRHNPNEALSWLLKGMLHAFSDEADQAISHVDKARALSPVDPFGYFYDSLSATAYLAAEKYDDALLFAEKSIAANNRHLSTLRARISALYQLGRIDELRAQGSYLLERQPDCTIESYLRNHPAANNKIGKNMAEAMKAAGIP